MPPLLLLDTDVLIEYLRGRAQAAKYLESLEGKLMISAATVAELYSGIRGRAEEATLEFFLSAFEVLPITDDIARIGGQLRRTYGPSHGVGLLDALIAATAREHSAMLVTFNVRHFPMLPNATVPYERR